MKLKKFSKKLRVIAIGILLTALIALILSLQGQNMILYAFMPDGDWTKGNGITFYQADVTSPLSLSEKVSYTSEEMPGRDMSLMQARSGALYGVVTNYDFAQNYEVVLYQGNHVKQLKPHYIDLGIRRVSQSLGKDPKRIWAPEFFQDTDGTTYLFTTVNDKGETQDKSNEDVFHHSIYLSKIDVSNMKVLETRLVNLPSDKNYIDAHVFQREGKYYLLIKDEFSKAIDYYRSDDLNNWSLVKEDFLSYALGESIDYTEGQFTLNIEGTYYVFFDKYRGSGSYPKNQYVMTTTDFKNFSKPQVVTDSKKNILRHGSAIVYQEKPYEALMFFKVMTGIQGIILICYVIAERKK